MEQGNTEKAKRWKETLREVSDKHCQKHILLENASVSNLGCSHAWRIGLKCCTSHRKRGHPWGWSGVGSRAPGDFVRLSFQKCYSDII